MAHIGLIAIIAFGSQDSSEIDFKMKKSTQMRKLMDAYCNRQGVSVDSLRFYTPDGERISPEKTVEEVGILYAACLGRRWAIWVSRFWIPVKLMFAKRAGGCQGNNSDPYTSEHVLRSFMCVSSGSSLVRIRASNSRHPCGFDNEFKVYRHSMLHSSSLSAFLL